MQSNDQEECVLCCREITIYATGACDHPVCYECSARMRVLCETNECPICRSDMPLVVFTFKPCTYSEVFKNFSLRNRQYHISFEDAKALDAFELLLVNSCPVCQEQFTSFDKLKDHVRRKHELHYCDLCSSSLKIFTFERKCYNRQDLARHKRKGDPDNTSHRGHPLCEFCDTRYVDHDELYRHLRREHYFCHFCDADGLHQYYKTYDYLRVHFRTGHYLCEEGDCINEKFTAAFRTEIDLKAHKATQHSKNKTKAEARQARMLDFEFNYVPHTRPTGNSSPRGRRYIQQRRNEEHNSQNSSKNQPEIEPLNTESTQDFPYLSEDSVNSSVPNRKQPVETTINLQSFGRTPVPSLRRGNMMSAEDFPALGSSAIPDTSINQSRKLDYNMVKQNNASNGISQISRRNEPTQMAESKKKDGRRNGQNSQKASSKWLPKKDSPNFEDNFPKLETKRAPLAATPTVEAKVSSMQNYPAAQPSGTADEDILQSPEEQFVILKNKSKKKKHKVPVTEEEEDIEEKKVLHSLSSINRFSCLNNQENKDPIRPSLPVRPPPVLESDTWETKVSFGRDDFPPLEVKKKPPPPGLNVKKSRAPPPGFSSNVNINTTSSLSMSSIAKILENNPKNNINGVHDTAKNKWVYQEPPNCQMRNEKLIYTIDCVSQTPEKFQEFKTVSRNFRCNTISASNYHSKCLDILGEEGFQDIFPELICLLPDIPKQQELLAVHTKYLNELNSNVKRKNKLKSKNRIQSCHFCNQVLLEDDYKSHECVPIHFI